MANDFHTAMAGRILKKVLYIIAGIIAVSAVVLVAL